jgi:hypothetical protein
MTEYKENKFVILCDAGLEKAKIDELNDQLVLLQFNDKCYQKNISEILERQQGILLDMGEESHRSWYASQKNAIKDVKQVKRIYIAKNGSKIDIQKVKEQTDVQNVLKNLPLDYKNATDFATRLLSDHIGKVNVGKLTRLARWLKSKIRCCGS